MYNKIVQILDSKPFVLIGIDGCGGSGKSTMAQNIAAKFKDTQIVHMDDFYKCSQDRDMSSMQYVPTGYLYDINRVLEQVIVPLEKNEVATYSRYDWPSDSIQESNTISPCGVIIIEGVYATINELRKHYDICIFVDCPKEVRLKRGLERDGQEALSQWEEWMQEEDKYLAQQKPKMRADYIVNGITGAIYTEKTPPNIKMHNNMVTLNEPKKKKQSTPTLIPVKIIFGVCLALLVLIFMSYANTKVAIVLSKTPIIGYMFEPLTGGEKKMNDTVTVFNLFSLDNLKEASKAGKTNLVNIKQQNDNVTFAIKEYYYKDDTFSIGLVVKGTSPKELNTKFSIFLNGQLISGKGEERVIEDTRNLFYLVITKPLTAAIPSNSEVRLVGVDADTNDTKFIAALSVQ